MFWAELWKISDFFIWKFSVFGGEIFNIFEQACFRNEVLIFHIVLIFQIAGQNTVLQMVTQISMGKRQRMIIQSLCSVTKVTNGKESLKLLALQMELGPIKHLVL